MRTKAGAPAAGLGPPWWVRLRAMLAAGLVLGVGATWTLAGWTDRVLAETQLAASTFTVEANATAPYDGAEGNWAVHDQTAAGLEFGATGMTPGSVKYAPLALRTAAGSIGGQATLSGAEIVTGDPALADALVYRAVIPAGGAATCDESAFSTGADYLVGGQGSSAPLSTGQDPSAPFTLPWATEGAPGEPVHLCLELTLPTGAPSELQGAQLTARWSIDALSVTT